MFFLFVGTDNALKSFQLTPLQQLGIKIAVRYKNLIKHYHVKYSTTAGNKDSSQVIKQYHVKYITTAGNKDSSQLC